MSHIHLICTRCGTSHEADMLNLRCGACRTPLDVAYSRSTDDAPGIQPPEWAGPEIPLPIHDPAATVWLGEGNTPSVALPVLGNFTGLDHLYGKLEFLNPTGSFKDRGTAVMLAVAREQGVTELVEDSSGNAGASVSAYAARAGIRAHIFAPASAPQAKIGQIEVYGATSHSVPGSREATTDAAIAYYTSKGLVYASHNLSPYFIEGAKSFAYEVFHQFPAGLPDHIVVPVGNGSLFIGAWKGFQELRNAGHITGIPKLHCVQAKAFMPVVAAHNGQSWTPAQGARTVAGGISSAAPPRMGQILEVLRASGGTAVAVEDADALRWQRLLAEKEGIYAEPTSAAAFAGLEVLAGGRTIQSGESVLVPVTGFGLKEAVPV